jgi:acyl-CoA thioesterase YciA
MEGVETPPAGSPAIRTIAMPADTNPAGDIFGGWLMSQMDLAAGNLAALTARGRAATVAVEGMKFHRPVKVGDEVSLFAEITRLGRTSMNIHVTAWRRSRASDDSQKVTCATFAFVALDSAGKPRPVASSDES